MILFATPREVLSPHKTVTENYTKFNNLYLCLLSRIRAGTVLGLAANISALLSLLLSPYIPATCETLRQQLNFSTTIFTGNFFRQLLPTGHKINKVGRPLTFVEKLFFSYHT